ncbi:DEHA2C09812p [Debaryomyces hansenii CBS767]|uniref:DEHA2C09812p n=1 Tax=Debaryomyces hansenii (strain ATCC 36239 / CBS 767 / BCRC 21394 / JCM 1990 / NBRC 0083 / IGC 2968) TaxID=284592 RepID=Q6BUK9_DEBHA|nr:DEHA2C09812p [Debaryomyces hansenii CBS767]CAG86181.2 DEHA2C09812p [Debaryomyces hansenii CBS767]|eukprot:XP_458110.2 DEHA2C09812p [Debaryomyces hansenii CBS767]
MFEELTPPAKHARHGFFGRYFYVAASALLGFGFVHTLLIMAVFYYWYHVIIGKEKSQKSPDEKVPYPDIKSMKRTSDLRYYALAMKLDLQEYRITTEDGYILTLHRLVDPNETELQRQSRKPVLLQHGLLSCSGSYVTSGYHSLAYHVLTSGYDVWLGNNRSWFEAKHAFYEGDLLHSEEYWDWDIRELAYYDLPCIIDNVLAHKPQHDKLSIIGHSQGCTQTFLMLKNGNLADYHKKVEIFFQLAPAIFPGPLFYTRTFIKFMHHRSKLGYKLFFGCCSFLRVMTITRNHLCTTRFFGSVSYVMFKFLFGWSGGLWNSNNKVRHFHFIFNVSRVSSKLMSWWLSQWVEEGFSNQLQSKESYKTGENFSCTPVNSTHEVKGKTAEENDSKTYFPYKEQWFGLEEKSVIVPMVVFPALEDYLVDGKRLATHMRHYERNVYKEGVNLDIHEIPAYDHLDVIWADNVIDLIGVKITEKLKLIESQNIRKDASTETGSGGAEPYVPSSTSPQAGPSGH